MFYKKYGFIGPRKNIKKKILCSWTQKNIKKKSMLYLNFENKIKKYSVCIWTPIKYFKKSPDPRKIFEEKNNFTFEPVKNIFYKFR